MSNELYQSNDEGGFGAMVDAYRKAGKAAIGRNDDFEAVIQRMRGLALQGTTSDLSLRLASEVVSDARRFASDKPALLNFTDES